MPFHPKRIETIVTLKSGQQFRGAFEIAFNDRGFNLELELKFVEARYTLSPYLKTSPIVDLYVKGNTRALEIPGATIEDVASLHLEF
jgi:hypothetical protein